MIDLHCHILPEIDDGASNLNEALEMARIAQHEGIKKMVNTSHFHPDFKFKMGKILQEEVNNFNLELKKNNIDIEVLLGNELYYYSDLIENLDDLDFYTINNSKYILIEFSPVNVPKNLSDIIYEIKL